MAVYGNGVGRNATPLSSEMQKKANNTEIVQDAANVCKKKTLIANRCWAIRIRRYFGRRVNVGGRNASPLRQHPV